MSVANDAYQVRLDAYLETPRAKKLMADGHHLFAVVGRMVCKDGFSMSVQAGYGKYSSPREDCFPEYDKFEVGYPSDREELLMPYVEDEDRPTETVYGYVPAEVLDAVIAKHGGLE